MDSIVQWWLAVGTFTCLISFPQTVTFSSGLRDEAVAYRVEGYQRQQRGDKEGALANYQKAVALDPAYPAPQNDLGVLFEEMGRLEEAKLAYERALAIDPDYLEAHSNLAMLHERLGEKEQAIFHWLKRYQLGNPEDAWTSRAEERLVALGILKASPGLKGKSCFSIRAPASGCGFAQDSAPQVESEVPRAEHEGLPARQQLVQQELKGHEQSLKEFQTTTKQFER